ncbi:hypothetical protein BsIDN1_23910 [Bacillus safensis]|uniref:VTT domain-containing protein n=1 Tax=Bacillus safensis TaxID=561879 RepID=A0A5S9M6M8_BACIA|nr:hypothetical protein BsIDN1_23910 [Bacillus safensis]
MESTFFIKPESLDKSDAFFEKHGGFVAFSGRFIPGVRTLISIPCGIAKMNVGVFCLYTFLAITPITFVYVYLGFMLGENWKEVGAMIDPYLFTNWDRCCVIVCCLPIDKTKKKKKTETPTA